MSDYGFVVCEHPPEVRLDEEVGGFSVWRTYRYGKVTVTVYRKSEKNEE
jgi:16S rRNA G966 N2-methylase RsmD